MENNQFAIWYSITRDIWVSYFWFYKSDLNFNYYKLNPLVNGIQEIYIWADEKYNKISILAYVYSTSYKKYVEYIFDDINNWIQNNNISEIHYSEDKINNDSTIYIYSQDFKYISFLYTKMSKMTLWNFISMSDIKLYCLKIKKDINNQLFYSIVCTSKNFSESNILFDSITHNLSLLSQPFNLQNNMPMSQFCTYELSILCESIKVENYIFFKYPRYNPWMIPKI